MGKGDKKENVRGQDASDASTVPTPQGGVKISAQDATLISSIRSTNNTVLLASFMQLCKFGSIRDIAKPEFTGFGLKNSSVYRSQLMSIMLAAGLDNDERTMVIAMAVMVKNKKRIVASLMQVEAPWVKRVLDFYRNRTVQYTKFASTELPPQKATFPVVCIPSAVPFVSCLIYVIWRSAGPVPLDDFLGNTWAAQLNLDAEAQGKQQKLEEDFWNNQVKTTHNTSGGFVAGFNEEFYRTKAEDNYPMMLMNGTAYNDGGPYSTTDIIAYIAKVKADFFPAEAVTDEEKAKQASQSGHTQQ